MKRLLILVAVLSLSVFAAAQKADAALVVGGSFVSDATGTITSLPGPNSVTITSGHHIFFEGALGVRLLNAHVASLYAELPVAGIPSQDVTLAGIAHPADQLGTVFIAPGLRLKLASFAPISPWVSVGGGWAHYSLSDARVTQNTAVLQYGGGLDFKTGLPLLGFRAEVRDFVTETPSFGFGNFFTTQSGLHHHNVLAGGGLVLRF
jgi:hypothetical protein